VARSSRLRRFVPQLLTMEPHAAVCFPHFFLRKRSLFASRSRLLLNEHTYKLNTEKGCDLLCGIAYSLWHIANSHCHQSQLKQFNRRQNSGKRCPAVADEQREGCAGIARFLCSCSYSYASQQGRMQSLRRLPRCMNVLFVFNRLMFLHGGVVYTANRKSKVVKYRKLPRS